MQWMSSIFGHKSKQIVSSAQLTSFVISTMIAIVSTIFFTLAQPELPLLYTLPRSEQALVSKIYIFILPAISFGMLLLNNIILLSLKEYQDVIYGLVHWTSAGMQIILLTALVRIIFITT